MECVKCCGLVKSDELMKCTACACLYHHVCIGITDTDFKKILPMNKLKWKCPSCKLSKTGHSHHSSPVATKDCYPAEESHSIMNVEARSIMAHIDARFNILQNTIEAFKSEVTEQLNNLTVTVNTWEGKIKELESSVSTLTNNILHLESERESMLSEVAELKSILQSVRAENIRNEQWVRRSNLQINGVPQREGENLFQVIRNLANKTGFALNIDADIDFVTRIAIKNGSDSKKPKPIIVKFQARYKKDEFLSAVRKFKNLKAGDLGFSGAPASERIYVNDHLSTYNRSLLQKAKTTAREKNYAYCWVRNCTIMVRRSDKSPVIHITSEENLKKIT